MKAIMISIRPEWTAKILNGEKTIEIRKTMPKCEMPVEVYIYCTKAPTTLIEVIEDGQEILNGEINETGKKIFITNKKFWFTTFKDINGKKRWLISLCGEVVAKFTLNKVEKIESEVEGVYEDEDFFYDDKILINSCLTEEQLEDYLYSKDGEGYAWHIDNLEVFDKTKELKEFGLTKAPQSWCYVEVE